MGLGDVLGDVLMCLLLPGRPQGCCAQIEQVVMLCWGPANKPAAPCSEVQQACFLPQVRELPGPPVALP